MSLTTNSTPPAIATSSAPNGAVSLSEASLTTTPVASDPKPTPVVSPRQMNLVFYFIGGAAVLLLVLLLLLNLDKLSFWFEARTVISLAAMMAAASFCNYFPFQVPPNLYISLSNLLYFTAFMVLPALPAALIPAIASLFFELNVVKRGLAYAARTCGMYIFATVCSRLVYEALGGGILLGDVTIQILLPVLAGFVVFRAINELIVGLTQYMQGYGVWAVREHVVNVTTIYLLCLPMALLIAQVHFNIGPVAFVLSCVGVSLVGYILNRATNAREKEAAQVIIVQELNQKLAYQNSRQLDLGNRINYTLDSFLTLVREYAGTSHEQEAAVVEITSTIEELSRTASQIALAADNVAGAAEQAIETADTGQHAVNATIDSINEVSAKVREISEKISELDNKAERINEVVNVINSIAGEIRLLALNATIEASGAGQFGRRFSIVANEVNLLADRSREALLQIRQIISEIQMATVTSRRVTEEGLQRMTRGVEMVSRSQKANREIIEVVQKTAQAAAAISLATQQQRAASEQVVTSIHDVAVMIGQNAEKVASVSDASHDLKRIASELRSEE